VLIAASHGHCDALRLLLLAGGDACQTDVDGNDAQRYAQESGCLQCCALVNCSSGLYPSSRHLILGPVSRNSQPQVKVNSTGDFCVSRTLNLQSS